MNFEPILLTLATKILSELKENNPNRIKFNKKVNRFLLALVQLSRDNHSVNNDIYVTFHNLTARTGEPDYTKPLEWARICFHQGSQNLSEEMKQKILDLINTIFN